MTKRSTLTACFERRQSHYQKVSAGPLIGLHLKACSLIPENAPAIPQGITKSPSPGQINGTNIPIDAAIRKSLNCQEATTAACQTCAIMRATALLYAAHVVVITVHCWLRQADRSLCKFAQWCRITGTLTVPHSLGWQEVVTAIQEGAQSEADGRSLEVLLDVVSAILENNTLFIEPYVSNPPSPLQLSQLIDFVCAAAPMIACYLVNNSPFHASTISWHPLRTSAAQTLSHLLTPHLTAYPSPRIMKTLLVSLISFEQIQGHPERCHSRPRGNRKGGGKERSRGGWRSQSCWKWVHARETGPPVDLVMVSVHAITRIEHLNKLP